LTHIERRPLDLNRAMAEHAAYERLLTELGATVRHLQSEPDLPDAVFVEDTAIVPDEIAVITRPRRCLQAP
jgi:dimethylargininase